MRIAYLRTPKTVYQPYNLPSGRLSENGKFFEAALEYKKGLRNPEIIDVYEKMKKGIGVYNGRFKLVDAWRETRDERLVFKFKLEVSDEVETASYSDDSNERTRVIPAAVKQAVWKRDKGRCVECGSANNLHFDHIIPYSKGGTSMDERNIQLLCQKHNLQKHDSIQ